MPNCAKSDSKMFDMRLNRWSWEFYPQNFPSRCVIHQHSHWNVQNEAQNLTQIGAELNEIRPRFQINHKASLKGRWRVKLDLIRHSFRIRYQVGQNHQTGKNWFQKQPKRVIKLAEAKHTVGWWPGCGLPGLFCSNLQASVPRKHRVFWKLKLQFILGMWHFRTIFVFMSDELLKWCFMWLNIS